LSSIAQEEAKAAKFKAKYALDENFFRELPEDLRWQSNALHLLLSATALYINGARARQYQRPLFNVFHRTLPITGQPRRMDRRLMLSDAINDYPAFLEACQTCPSSQHPADPKVTTNDQTNAANRSPVEVQSIAGSGLSKSQCKTLLVAVFKDSTNAEEREDEVKWLRKQKDEQIKFWCGAVLDAVIARQRGGVPPCPGQPKRPNCNQHPDYPRFLGRFKAAGKVLKDEKRVYRRFQGRPGREKRIADDPVYEQDNIRLKNKSNDARALREPQRKENELLEGWRKVQARQILSQTEIDYYVNLAEYKNDPTSKNRAPPTPV
jgi:hypothetical protein